MSVVTSLKADTDYTVSGTLSETGSVSEDTTYTVTITAVDGSDYEGTVTKEWTIKAPSGSFDATALSAGAGCTASGNAASVNNSAALAYDSTKKVWTASMTIKWPAPETTDYGVLSGNGTATYVDLAHAFVKFDGSTFTGAQVLDGETETPGLTAATAQGQYNYTLNSKTKFTYFSSLTYTFEFSDADIEAAKASGKIEKTVEVWSTVWSGEKNQGHPTGLKPTTYTLTVPIDKNLKLFDENNQVYPPQPYIANIGAKKFLNLADALGSELATADVTVEVFADAAAEGEVVVPVGVTLNLGSHGNAGTSYVLTGAELDASAKVISSKDTENVSATGVKEGFFKVAKTEDSGIFTYALEPNHEHMWGKFELAGNVLTATCTNGASCTYEDGTVSITLNAEDKVWDDDNSAVTPTLSGREAFERLLTEGGHAVTVGEVMVEHPAYSTDKWRVGLYTAKCTVTIDGEDYELTKAFEITKPAKYTNGFEAQIGGYGVRFGSLNEAVGFVPENSVITLCYDGWNSASFIATASKDITLDLGGKELTYSKTKEAASDFTIKNDGAGTVTLVNGTIKQPVGQTWSVYHYVDVYYGVTVSGPFAFGNDLTVTKLDDSLTVTANDSLEVVDGRYQSAFAGETKISGGVFTVEPTLLVEGYAVRSIEGDYPYEVIKHEHEMVTDIIGENTLSNYCAAGGCDLAVGQWATLAVTTPATYTSKAFAGATKTGDLAATLTYFKGETQLEGAPTAVGDDYKVVMSYNGKAVTNGFEITTATIDSMSFDPATADFTGSPITTKMTVKAGSLTLGDGDYDITAGSLTETGSAAADTTNEVTVVGKGNFQGTLTKSWTIKAPTGLFASDALSTSAAGCTASGNAVTVTDSMKLAYVAENTWRASAVIKFPVDLPTLSVTQNDPDVKYIDEAHALIESTVGSVTKDVKNKQYKAGIVLGDHNYIDTITWTVDIPLADITDAIAAGKTQLDYTITVGALAWTHYTSGLKPAAYTLTIPLEGLVLNDEFGNQVYPHVDYVAQIGTKKYDSLTNALKAAEADQTVKLIADAEKADFEIPANVTVKLYKFGANGATYKLLADETAFGAMLVSSNKEEVAAATGFDVDETFADEVYTYTLQKSHVHKWGDFATGDTNVLTAACTNYDKACTVEGRAITLTLMASDVVYGTVPDFGFDADEKDAFTTLVTEGDQHMLDIGEVSYIKPAYSQGKWYAGDYTAVATVTVDGAALELKKDFKILPMEYTDGFVVSVGELSVRFDTLLEATKEANEGDTIYYKGGDLTGKEVTFSSSKDITLDLGGAALKHDASEIVTIKNAGAGTVTLTNGTIVQPKGTYALSSAAQMNIEGNFAFADIETKNRATSGNNFFTITVKSGTVTVLGGQYTSQFKTDGGTVIYQGGKFWDGMYLSYAQFTKPTPDAGYIVISGTGSMKDGNNDDRSFAWEVVAHEHGIFYSAAGNVITASCTNEHSDACGYGARKLTLVATNEVETGVAYAGASLKPDADFPLPAGTEITYWQDNAQLQEIPSEPGDYEARVTIDGATAVASFTIDHQHVFSYAADDEADTITVTCEAQAGGCAYKTTPSVATLKADNLDYTGEAYVGAKADKSDNFPAEVTLTYFKSETPLGDALAGAPTDAGEYVVRMSAGGQSVEKTFTIVQAQLSALNLKTAVFSYDGTEKTAEIESVKAGENGAFTLKPEEYEVSGDELTQVGSLVETKQYSVVVTAKAGGNYTGSVQMSWKIEAPSGAFAGMTTSTAGCEVSGEGGTVVTVTDSRELKYDAAAKAWKFSLTVTLPKSKTDIYNVNPASLVRFELEGEANPVSATDTTTLGEHGITVARAGLTDIMLGSHSGEMDVGSFTWTGSFTLDDVENAARQNGAPKLTKSLQVYELAYSETVQTDLIGLTHETMHNNGGIAPTTFTLELPVDETLVLLDEDQNQVYPHVNFVAQVGKTKYESLDAALAAAAETAGVSKTNVVTAIGTVTNGSYAVGKYVKLELGAYGADSTYVLGADAVLTADAALANVSAASGSELMSAGDSPVTYWTIKAHEHAYGHTAQGAVLTEFCTKPLNDGNPCGVTNLCTLGDASKVYDGKAPTATVDDRLEAAHTTGKVLYLNTDRSKVSAWNVGTYLSVVTVSVDSVGYELSREFTISPADLKDAAVTLSATELAYNGKVQTVSVRSVKVGDLTLTKDTDYTVDGTLAETGIFNGTQEYAVTVTAVAGGNFTGSTTVTWKIVSKPRDFGAVTKNNAAGNASYDEKSRTLTVSDGTGWTYYTADKAPDGSGIEGWYAGLNVAWPSDIDLDLSGFKLLYTRPDAARFTVNAIKAEGSEEKRIFNGTNSIPGVTVNTLPIDLSKLVKGLDLTRVTSFTWWERLTLADLEAARSAERKTIERTVTAWGEVWSDTFKAGLIFQTEREYGDPDGVRPTTYKLVANLEGLTLYDNEGLAWPQHEHEWKYVANDASVTATCAIAGCRYERSPVGVTLSADPAERLCNGLPLAATLANAETFRGVTKSEVSGILYTGTDYTGAAYESAEAPVQPGSYRATAMVSRADGEVNALGLALTIREGLVVVDGQHYEDPAEVLEKSGSDLVKVSVWKDFTAGKTYELPASGTKILDLAGKTVRAPAGETVVITNLGALTVIDSAVTPQEAAKGTYRGKLYGDIVNAGTLTVTGGYIDGTIVNAGGTVLLSGGVFRVRPDAKWLADGCKIVTRSGLYYVEGHLHQYVLVRSLGGSLVFATCMNILADGTLQASECDAREVIFLLSPMQGLLAGAVSVPTTSLEYDGRPKAVELTAFNLWALRELIRIPSLADLGETWELIQKVIKLTQGGGSITDGAEVLTEILEALAERGFNPADFVLSADKVAALTGIEAGTVAYTCGGEPVEGVPVNAGTYRATMTLTGGDGRSQTIVSTYTINPTDIAAANPNITCDPKRRTFQYDQEEKVISVKSVALDSPATVQIRKFLAAAQEFMSEPDWNGAMNLLSMLNDLAVDLPQPPDFWKDYGILKALDFVADFMTYLTTDVIEYLQYEITAVTLVEGVDYTIGGTTAATEIGAYVLTVDGMGNYKGSIPVDWTISYDHNGEGHDWRFAGDGTPRLTATCGTHPDDCLISPAVIELVPDTVAEKAYDGVPLTASLSNAFLFATYTGATNIGAVVYRDADGAALASAPVAVGEYWATADVVAAAESGGSTNTLKLALTITIPEGGFTDGYEVRASGAEYGVRHDTLAQALAAAKTGDTIFAHDGITGKGLDFTTDADVTIDLCGKTLTASPTSTLLGNNDMTLANAGVGTVTFVNGTIRQPLHYILGQQNADQLTIASGTFVFGEKLATANVATSQVNFFTVTVADGASLAITDGKHDAKFAGDVMITGGSFWSNFDPTPFLPEGRITRPDPDDATRTVIVEHWHNVVATAEGDTISMFCRTEGDCDLKTPATVTLSVAAETVYNGQPVEATVTKAGNPVYTLAYFTDEDPRVALGGAPTASGAYVAVLSMGEASVEKRFAIVPAETRPFGAVTSAIEGVGMLEGNVLTVTDSLKLDYDPADQTWSAGLAIAVPHTRWSYSLSGGYTPPVYTDAEHLSVSVPDEVELQTKTEGVKIDLLRIDWSYEYVDAVLWMPRFRAEDVQRAIEAGQDSLMFELTLSADVWEYDINGLTKTTYTIVVPLAGLVLNDERGVQIYPEHNHVWAFSSKDGVLTATCGTADCPQGTLTLVLAAADKVFDHRPLEATLTGADAFVLHTGATVGEIVYFDAEGRTLAAAPSLVGEYAAQVTVVPAGDEPIVLEKAFAITVPEGGFTDGYEVNGVCYDTFAAALAAAGEGDTLYLREPLGNQALFDFTSEKDVTVDLCGQTLTYERSQAAASDLTIQNVSTGVVTLVNGTIQQPRGQSRQTIISPWQNVYYNVDVTGPFVFGEGMATKKRGTAFTVSAAAGSGGSTEIVAGTYESAFAGELVITGGTFASDPGEFLPEGYMAVEGEGVWVVINHTHAYAYAAEGQTNIVRTCVGGTDPCPDAPVSITLSVAAETAYTGNPVAATVTPSNAFDHALAYYAAGDLDTPLGGAPADAGEYAVVMSAGEAAVTNGFAITPVALTSLALAEESFVCDGMPKTNAVTEVQAGAFTLTADDYTVTGDALVQTGSAFSNVTYAVIATGKGNFTGSATNTWTILAPNGSFEEGYGDGEGYEEVPGAASVGEELTYDGKGTWYAHLEVTWPASLSAEGPSHFTPVGKFLVTPSDALVDVHTNSAPDAPYEDYVAGFTWSVAVTPEMLTEAAGDLVFTLKAMGLADEVRSPSGIAEQTFTLTVPKGTPLVDETGCQVYPAFEAWRNLYCHFDLADFGLDIPLNAKAVKAEGLPTGLKLVKTAVKDAAGKTTVGYRYAIEGVPTELMDNETRPAYVRITDAAGVQTLWPLVLRVSEPEPGEDVEGTVGSPTLVIGGKSNDLFRVTKIWSDAEIGWTYKGWPSGVTYDKDTGYFRGTPKKAGRYTLTATSGKVGSTTYKNVRTATFTVWADADGELSELTGQAYVAQTNGMDRFGAVKSVTGLPTGLKFTAKDVTDRTYGAIPSNTVYGLPTKAGTFAVTLTLADKSKKSLLWTIAPAVAPTCEVVLGDEADTPVERRRAQLVRGSARRYEIETSDPKATVTVSGLPSGLTLKKTAVKDASGKTAGYTYALEGVPTKVGEFFVTVKTTLNGVTTVSTLAFTVNENPFTGLYKGLTALDGRIGAAELSAAAGGTVKLTLKEGKTTYTANVKSFEWNGTNESGRAVFLLKANSADKKTGFPDREIEAVMLSGGTATVCDIRSPEETSELVRTVKPTAEEMLSFTATYRFATEADDPIPLAVLAVVYDAKKATASVKGKLADGTSVSMASIAVLGNGFLAPVQAVDKSGTAWVFDRLGFEGPETVGSMSRMGKVAVETITTYGSDVTANPKPKFGEVVTEETTLDLAFGDERESFRLVPNGKGGVAVYEAGTANPLLTVSSAFANGLLSFSFTSKTGDKAKYAVDLALDAESLPSGQVLRTWKDGSTSLSSAGVVLLTVQR